MPLGRPESLVEPNGGFASWHCAMALSPRFGDELVECSW